VRAVAVLTKACDAGAARGCSTLATLAYNGVGVTKDKERAVALFKKALTLDPKEQLAVDSLKALGITP